jgi:hypothetical protein
MSEDNSSDGDRGVRVVGSDSSARAPELVRLFLREIDTAAAYIVKLRHATSGGDLAGALGASLSLSQAWGRAKTAIFVLESQSQRSEVFARDALQHSFDAARDPLSQAWELLCPDEQWSSREPARDDIRLQQEVATNHKRHHDQ